MHIYTSKYLKAQPFAQRFCICDSNVPVFDAGSLAHLTRCPGWLALTGSMAYLRRNEFSLGTVAHLHSSAASIFSMDSGEESPSEPEVENSLEAVCPACPPAYNQPVLGFHLPGSTRISIIATRGRPGTVGRFQTESWLYFGNLRPDSLPGLLAFLFLKALCRHGLLPPSGHHSFTSAGNYVHWRQS